jgi:polysaccharide chain length determinant protein (PEP-CTERM system associated)
MLPGKKYTVDDALRILRRRYWLLLVPCAVVGALAAARADSQPNLYSAETVILVLPQTVPESIVPSVSNTRVQDRLPMLRTSILSRTRLERVILEHNLYPDERAAGWPIEQVVRMMSDNITTQSEGTSSFRVGYTGQDPQQVKAVTDRLAELFVQESLQLRQNQAENTTEFLDSELAELEKELQVREARLASWKVRYAGEMPTQVDGNLQVIQTANMSLRDLRASITADNQARLEYQRQLTLLQDPASIREAATSGNPSVEQALTAATASTAQLVATAQTELDAQVQRGRKAGHPDYDAAERKLRDMRARLQREITGASGSLAGATLSPAELQRRERIDVIRKEVVRIEGQIARAQEQVQRLEASSAEAQRRVEAAPRRETELADLTRDYESIRGAHGRMLANKQASRVAANLERKTGGDQFQVQDPAQVPERPVSPNRRQDVIFGLLAGLIIGAVLIALLEYLDKSFHLDEDVASVLDLPVLAVVPVMRSEEDLRKESGRRTLTVAGLGSLVTACLAFAAWVSVR